MNEPMNEAAVAVAEGFGQKGGGGHSAIESFGRDSCVCMR